MCTTHTVERVVESCAKVIFLDIDGVLNSTEFLPMTLCLGWEGWKENIDPDRVSKLNTLVGRTQATVVLSSTWRFHWPADVMQSLLEDCGYMFEIHSVTPTNVKNRVDAIWAWLEQHPEVQSWVALDDSPVCEELGEHWVRMVDGMEDEHVEEAARKLV